MKLSEIRSAYEAYSGKLSSVNRQLAFAGIAVIWLFRISDHGKITIPEGMIIPIFLFVVSFFFDILQLLSQSLIWYSYYWYKRKKGTKEDDEMNEPEWPNIIPWSLLILKVIALIIAYWFLGLYLLKELCAIQ